MEGWQRWKAWERNWTLNPCKYCDTHADSPLNNWKNGTLHRWWCPVLARKVGWAAAIFPVWFRWLGLDWWLRIATGILFLVLAVVLPWLAKRYGPIRQLRRIPAPPRC